MGGGNGRLVFHNKFYTTVWYLKPCVSINLTKKWMELYLHLEKEQTRYSRKIWLGNGADEITEHTAKARNSN